MTMHITSARLPHLLLGACAPLLLGACAAMTHTPYQRPAMDLPAQWQGAQAQKSVAPARRDARPQDGWWRDFHDPDLNALIDALLARNNDLAAATIKVRKAQLEAGLAQNDLTTPSSSVDTSASGSRTLNHGPSTSRSASITGSLSYELDLWGRLSSLRDQAQWEALATDDDRAATRLSLIGTAADLYWEIAYLNERLALNNKSVAYAARILQLVEIQHKAGAVSGIDVEDARQTLTSERATRTQLEQQRTEDLNALAILFDGPPGETWANPQRLPTTLPTVASGVPTEVLSRRPDVRAAERRLREALGNIDSTRTSYYPTLSLTGDLGSSSSSLHQVLSNPVATLGAGLVLPFVEVNEMRLNVGIARAEYEESVVEFRQTLYAALSDVENALSAREQYEAQRRELEATLASARRSETLYEAQYRAGAVPLSDWLDAQESRRSAEESLTENTLSRLTNLVTLYQALGGRPTPSASPTATPTPGTPAPAPAPAHSG